MNRAKHKITYILIVLSITSCLTENYIKETAYNGKIQEIYDDTKNRNSVTFSIKTDNEMDKKIVAEFFPYSWEYASVGDSIIKEKGELYIRIKKKNGDSKVFYFDP